MNGMELIAEIAEMGEPSQAEQKLVFLQLVQLAEQIRRAAWARPWPESEILLDCAHELEVSAMFLKQGGWKISLGELLEAQKHLLKGYSTLTPGFPTTG